MKALKERSISELFDAAIEKAEEESYQEGVKSVTVSCYIGHFFLVDGELGIVKEYDIIEIITKALDEYAVGWSGDDSADRKDMLEFARNLRKHADALEEAVK